MEDKFASEAFLTGGAGTGKTTQLQELVPFLLENKITFQVVAFTHTAKDVLMSKLPENVPITTLHSWLKKRPTVNEKATHINSVVVSKQYGKPEPLQLLIVDEFSFVGDRDYMSIGEMIDPEGEGDVLLKTLYVGDPNQLPPIKDVATIRPKKPYHIHLTKVWRSNEGLFPVLTQLTEMIEGKREVGKIKETRCFVRNQDIVEAYKKDENPSKLLLAFTNERVQELNKLVQGRDKPRKGDLIYCSTLKEFGIFKQWVKRPTKVTVPGLSGHIDLSTKYNPLGFLYELDYVKFMELEIDSNSLIIACIFGYYNNKLIREQIGKDLVSSNKKLKGDSKLQYRTYKTVSDYVCEVDFPHCMTIHKSQGREVDTVYIDLKDLSNNPSVIDMLKLAYVGISRARLKVIST